VRNAGSYSSAFNIVLYPGSPQDEESGITALPQTITAGNSYTFILDRVAESDLEDDVVIDIVDQNGGGIVDSKVHSFSSLSQ